jgi:hypothetical protein
MTEAAFQRVQNDLGSMLVDALNVDDTRFQKLGDLARHEKPS